MFRGFSNLIDVFLRVGLVLVISGIFIGLLYSEWTAILPLGILLAFPAVVEQVIQGIKGKWSNEIMSLES